MSSRSSLVEASRPPELDQQPSIEAPQTASIPRGEQKHLPAKSGRSKPRVLWILSSNGPNTGLVSATPSR